MRHLITFLLVMGSVFDLFSQCSIDIAPDTIFACSLDTLKIEASAVTNQILYVDSFSTLTPGPLWTTLPLRLAPCPPNNNASDTIVAWFDSYYSTGTIPRTTAINGLDLTIPTDIFLQWDMKFAAGTSPANYCDDPNYSSEGIHLQYQANPNAWVDIDYFMPNGNASGPLYSWNTHQVQIPSIALSNSTSIRWLQWNYSGPTYDNWGIDNVVVKAASNDSVGSLASYRWYRNGTYLTDSRQLNLSPAQAGTYVVEMKYGACNVFDTVEVVVLPPPTIDLGNDTIVNLDDSIRLDANCAHCSYLWSTGDTIAQVLLDTSNLGSGTHIIWVEVSRGSSCKVVDSLTLTFSVWAGVPEIEKNKLHLYPNPGNDVVCINIQGNAESKAVLQIFNLQQKLIREFIFNPMEQNEYAVPVSTLRPGVYLFKLQTKSQLLQSIFIRN